MSETFEFERRLGARAGLDVFRCCRLRNGYERYFPNANERV